MRYLCLLFVILFTNLGVTQGQSDDHSEITAPISDRIPASSFNKTPITFLFAPSFDQDTVLISSLADTLYSRGDLIENRLDSDQISFTLHQRSFKRNTAIKLQGGFFKLELDSQLIANDLISHFMSQQKDGSLNFEKVLESTSLLDENLSRKDLEQISAMCLNRHLLVIFDLDESNNNRKRIIAHLYNLDFGELLSEYFFEHHWISSEDSDSTRKTRQLYYKLSPYKLNWLKSYSSGFTGPVNIKALKEVIHKMDKNVHGIPLLATMEEIDPILSEMGGHSHLHTGQQFSVYQTGYNMEKDQSDRVHRIILEKEGTLYVKNTRKKAPGQQVKFYQKGRVQLDNTKLLISKKSAGIGVYLGYEFGFQKVNQDQLSFLRKNGGVPLFGLEIDLSKYLSKGLKINVPHSIHLFAEYSHGLYFNNSYRYQVAEYITSINGDDFDRTYNDLDIKGFRDILEVQSSTIRFGLSKDFCLSPTWYLTPYLGLGFCEITPPEWPKHPSTSDNYPFSPNRYNNDFYELFIGDPVEFNGNDYKYYYHNLKTGLAKQQQYFLGMRISAALRSYIHVTGYIEARKKNTQLEEDREYYMPGIFILDEFGTRMGLSIKYEF